MNRRTTPVVPAAVLVFACSIVPVVSAATIQREFRYPASQINVRAEGIIDVERPGATREFRPGRPDLPIVSERIDLPAGMRVASIRVIDLVTAPLANRVEVPSAVIVKPGLGETERTRRSPEFFGRAGMQPSVPVELSYQGFQRGDNLAWLQVSPVRWDASSGRVERVERIRVELVLEPATEAPVARERVVPEWEDDRLMRSPGQIFMTGAAAGRKSGAVPLANQPVFEASQIPSVLGSPVAYVIVTNDSMASEFQRLADWKTQTGVPAVVRTMATIRQQYPYGSDDADRVRQFIRDAYSRWGTKWVLLGGDTEILPTRLAYTTFYGGEHIACDMYYSCLDGNWNDDGDGTFGEGSSLPGDAVDMLPDVWVGRAPVTTRSDAQLFVNKTLQYTKTPVGDYENSVLYFAEVLFPQVWSQGDFISLDGAQLVEETLPYLRSHAGVRYTRLYENYTDTRWEPGSYPENRQAVIDSLDRGYNMSVHVGHGYRNVMAVGNEQNLVNSDALGLTNGNRVTNLYSINCTSNAIDFPCIGEAFMLAPNGGSVTNVGSTRLDFPSAGRVYQKEFFKLIFQDSVTAVGEAQARQKLPFVGYSTTDNVNRWMQFTLLLLGDPELRIYTALPRTLAVTHPGSVFISDSTLSVTVKIGATPLPGARVVAFKAGDEYRIGTTDNSGVVVLPFRPDSVGSVTLTVTAYDARPFQAQITINGAAQPVLAERVPIIDDDNSGGTSGNSNGLLDAGETIDVKIQVKNNGSSTASGVNGTLSTTDPNVTVTQPAVTYGSIASGATTSVTSSYRISISGSAPDDRELSFNLRLADTAGRTWNERVLQTSHSARLRHNGESVVDAGGTSNGRPEPGETVQYLLKLKNIGTGSASAVTAKLRPVSGVTVSDSTATWGTINPGEEKLADAVTFVPTTTSAVVELRVSSSLGLLFTKLLDISIPATPLDLSGVGSTSSIALTWTRSTEPDLLGYNLYRSSSEGGPYTRLTAIPTERIAYYVDEGLVTLTRYFYKVAAVDSSCNESDRSAAVPVSTNPPNHAFFPTPIGLASQSSVAIEHIWSGYPLSIVTGTDELIYAWNPDGSAPVDADGSIATSGDFSMRGFNYRAPVSVADLDGDGYMDIVASSWDSLKTFAFTRNAQVRAGWPVSTTSQVWSAAAIGDLENDGKKEVIFASNDANIYAFRWNGVEVRDGDANPATIGVFKRVDTYYNFSTPAIADIDGDGRREVVFAAENGRIHALRSDGTAPAGWSVFLGSTGAHIFGSPAVGNLDGNADNEIDIVIPVEKDSGADSIYVLRANGQKKPGWPQPAAVGGMNLAPSPALADMNNDGKLDVVHAGTDGKLYVYNGNGTPLVPLNGVRFSTLAIYATESSPVVADIDGDGLNDIVIGDELGYLTAISGDGTVLPGFPILLGAEVKGTAALCDCDADGKTEIVFAGMDQKVYMWDYDFPFSPNGPAPWPQFHHDAARTGFAGQLAWTGVDDEKPQVAVRAVEFAAPYPNPSPGATRIAWAVPSDRVGEPLEVAVFDLSGRKVRVIERGPALAGRHSANWNLRDGHGVRVEAGVFFVKFTLGTDVRSQKLVVLQ